MLRYYEHMGLMESNRKDDYAYRVYDENALKRLQQIIILRKLQIPVKKISVILNNPDAATATDIFKTNISELQAEINALSTIKSALEIFVTKIEELAAVRLNLNLLTDESVIKLAESLSLIQKNVKEIKPVEELNRASENLVKQKQNHVRLVFLPPMTFAVAYAISDNPHEASKSIMKKFVKDVDLYKLKPDTRSFGWGNTREGHWVYDVMVSIPNNLEVPAPLIKTAFPGGLYATYTSNPLDFDDMYNVLEKWVENSSEYEKREDATPLEEAINPLSVMGIKNIHEETTQFMYFDFHLPVKPKQIKD